jgi:hypothetical protein
MDVLNDFLYQVFDTPMNHQDFIKGSDVVLDRVFDHPLLIDNIVFHHSYRHFFGIFASPQMFQQRSQDLLMSPCFELIHMFGTSGFASIEKYQTFIASIKNQLSDKEFRKTYVFTKLGERRGVTFSRTSMKQNVLLFFVNLPKLAPLPPKENTNPITNKRVILSTPCQTPLDVIMNDRQFIMKLFQRPVLAIHCQTPVNIINALITCLPANVLILDLTGSLPNEQVKAVCYPVQHQIYHMLPVIASMFILVSNALHPPVKSLSQNKQASLYYMRAWDANELEENLPTFTSEYSRILTNMPCSLPTSTPLPMYRVYDMIETPNVPAHLNTHVLKGKHSSQDQFTTGARVTTYTPATQCTQCFTHIVDHLGEIPTSDIYKLAIMNRIPLSHITSPIKLTYICAPLFSQAMFQNVWRAHIHSPADNVIFYYEFLYSYFERLPHTKQLIPSYSSEPTKTTLALLDNRENPLSVTSILVALTNIATPMSCHVFTSAKAVSYYKQYLGHLNVNIIDYPDLNIAHFNIDVYNQILKSPKFWKTLQDTGAEKVIIIQDDGILARPGIEDLIPSWDYIGAPWADVPGNEYIRDNFNPELVGNGGFSVRNIAKCRHITETYENEKYQLFFQNLVEIPEDVYFTMLMIKEKFSIAPRDIAAQLSSEQVLDARSLGFHKPWAYSDRSALQRFFTSFLPAL